MIKSKRISSFILALIFILSAVTLSFGAEASAESLSGSDAFEYELKEDGSIRITAYRGLGGSVKIPSRIDNIEVTGIGKSAFASCSQIEVLSIPVSVEEIDELAFSGCSKIKEISIPDEVIEIGKMAFANCTSLEIVNFGEKLKIVGDNAFMGCTSLSKLILPDSTEKIGEYAFFNCYSLNNLGDLINIKEVGGYAFENTGWMNNYDGDYIVIGDGMMIKYIGNAEKLELGGNIKSIGTGSFLGNKTVKSVKVSGGIEKILSGAFEDSEIESVDLLKSKTDIPNRAFADCSKLKDIKFSNNLKSIGEGAFQNCTALVNVALPDSLSKVGKLTFKGCSALKEVSLGKGVKGLGEGAFEECAAMGKIDIPNNITEVSDNCFLNCISLTRAVFEGNTKIGNTAFGGCENLEEAAFYGSSPSIDDHAFPNSVNLTIYASSGSGGEKYANDRHISFKPISEFSKDSYEYKGVLKVSDDSGFSGGYTLIIILLIAADIIVAFSISAYTLLKGPDKKSMRHMKAPEHARK